MSPSIKIVSNIGTPYSTVYTPVSNDGKISEEEKFRVAQAVLAWKKNNPAISIKTVLVYEQSKNVGSYTANELQACYNQLKKKYSFVSSSSKAPAVQLNAPKKKGAPTELPIKLKLLVSLPSTQPGNLVTKEALKKGVFKNVSVKNVSVKEVDRGLQITFMLSLQKGQSFSLTNQQRVLAAKTQVVGIIRSIFKKHSINSSRLKVTKAEIEANHAKVGLKTKDLNLPKMTRSYQTTMAKIKARREKIAAQEKQKALAAANKPDRQASGDYDNTSTPIKWDPKKIREQRQKWNELLRMLVAALLNGNMDVLPSLFQALAQLSGLTVAEVAGRVASALGASDDQARDIGRKIADAQSQKDQWKAMKALRILNMQNQDNTRLRQALAENLQTVMEGNTSMGRLTQGITHQWRRIQRSQSFV